MPIRMHHIFLLSKYTSPNQNLLALSKTWISDSSSSFLFFFSFLFFLFFFFFVKKDNANDLASLNFLFSSNIITKKPSQPSINFSEIIYLHETIFYDIPKSLNKNISFWYSTKKGQIAKLAGRQSVHHFKRKKLKMISKYDYFEGVCEKKILVFIFC